MTLRGKAPGMTMEHREELISAYLDGEVTPEERAQVEQWLANDPAMRRLHDELRGVRDSVQALPRHALDLDLAPLVLRRAEQEVLSGEPRTGPVQIASTANASVPSWSARRTWRRVLWPAVAIAAALAIKAFEAPPATKERQVATAPQGGELSAVPAEQRQQPTLSAAPAAPRSDVDRDHDYAIQARKPALAANESSSESAAPAGAAGAAMNAPTDAVVDAPARPGQASAAARMAAPPPASSSPAEPMLESSAVADTASPPVVLCEVSAAFIQQRGLERLLDERKIPWHPVPEPAAGNSQARRKASPGRQDAQNPKRQQEAPRSLLLDVTPEQLDALVADLRERAGEVGRVIVATELSDSLQKKPSEPMVLHVRFNLQAAEYVRPKSP